MSGFDDLFETYKKKHSVQDVLFEMVEKALQDSSLVMEQDEASAGRKFMMVIPKISPSEAWGDPNSMEREQVNEIFKVVRGGASISARIQSLNDYLDPAKAKRKRSPRVIINNMIILESLKAALNHFSESAAGFVLEAFMAALTGGFQQAERVGGTLPIEDFVAFTEFGGTPTAVSLKLLQKTTQIKGSFTNLVDYLFVRGEPSIKYLVAYKNAKSNIESLEIYDFTISRDNLVSFILGGAESPRNRLLGRMNAPALQNVLSNGTIEEVAQVVTKLPGYTKAGKLHAIAKQAAEKQAAAEAEDVEPPVSAETDPAPVAESFHEAEKQAMLEEGLLLEGKEGGTQWKVSFTMLKNLATVDLVAHGELDMSEAKIMEIAEIYAKTLGDQIINLMESVQSLTGNIGDYFSERLRSNAISAGRDASKDAEEIKTNLEGQLSEEDT